eukprot:scaffold1496_cov68-Attheya_sp.AAC.1
MTYNDTGYSAFWSRGDDTNTPQTLTRIHEHHIHHLLQVDLSRESTLARIHKNHAGITPPENARGWTQDTDGYPQQYDVPFSTTPLAVAVVSMATMNGGNGALAALAGLPRYSTRMKIF